jgi:protein-tyrosine phosphatase
LVNGKPGGAATYNPSIDAVNVLFLCTGNICRSPMAEGTMRARLADRGINAEVSSAGLTFDHRPATPEAVAVAAGAGVDIAEHRSRIVDAKMIDAADVVIGMERMHAREAAVLGRDSFSRSFTLKELVRRGRASGARRPGEPFDAWLARVGADRRPTDLLDAGGDDEVADPYRLPMAVYERCFEEIAALVDELVELAWPAEEGVAA